MDDQISLMRQAVAYHRVPDLDNALSAINRLIAQRPNDPFVHELKGQILLENRQAGPAATSYGRAVELAPRDALILAGYGRALLAQDNDQTNARALSVLERAYALDPRNSRLLRDLGLAYARDGQNGRASLAVAERYALIGRFGDASLHAQRALDQLPRGSAPWQKAQDVLDAAESLNRR
jgi:predicted Zn-dependent protease